MSTINLIKADDISSWRAALARFQKVDLCFLPEYHLAYASRINDASVELWTYQKNSELFIYPFIIAPVVLKDRQGEIHETGYYDISSVYGYSGPLSTTDNQDFLSEVWQSFDIWSADRKILAEFTRYSNYCTSYQYAHPRTEIIENREIAVSYLNSNIENFLTELDSKTRNMVSKAKRAGARFMRIDLATGLAGFIELYHQTMNRNSARNFFNYDHVYYSRLQSLAANELALYGVYLADKLVSSAMIIKYGKQALYHLGAGSAEYAKLGVSNLLLAEVTQTLISEGIEYFNLGGGRTTEADDPLLRFKKSNANNREKFRIGKRVILDEAYRLMRQRWIEINNITTDEIDHSQLLFYR